MSIDTSFAIPNLSSQVSGTSNGQSVSDFPDFIFREITESDKDEIKELHELAFPVRYADSFYCDIVKNIGPNGEPLFTVIAQCVKTGKIAGFIIAQIIPLREAEDKNLFSAYSGATSACYILTLATRPEYRRRGLASQFIELTLSHVRKCKGCGAIYLHVIHYNISAIRFYENNQFEFFRELSHFYIIDSIPYNSYLYIRYLRDYDAPFIHRIMHSARQSASSGISMFVSWVSSLFSGVAASQSGKDRKKVTLGSGTAGLQSENRDVPV